MDIRTANTDPSPALAKPEHPLPAVRPQRGEGSAPPPALPERSFDARARWGLLLTVLFIAVGWAHTFAEMWLRWFPAWGRSWPLMERLTKGDSYYTHGPLVPLTGLVIAFFIHRRVGCPVGRTPNSNHWGAWIVILSLLLQLVAAQAEANFASGFALIGLIAGLLLLWGGWPLLRAYWVPVLLLGFMVPLPMGWIADVNLRLKFLAGGMALWLTDHVAGVPALMNGSYVNMLAPDGKTVQTLTVEDVCSGLRSLISLTFFAFMFALICRVKGWWRLLMLLLALPVAVLCNVARIASLNVVAHHWGVENASPGSFWHDTSGLLVFVLALSLLFGFEQLVMAGSRWLGRHWTDPRLLGYLDQIKPTPGQTARTLRPVVLTALALVAGLSVAFASRPASANQGDLAKRALQGPDGRPLPLLLAGESYTCRDRQLDEQTLTILQTNDYLDRLFELPGGTGAIRGPNREVELFIVFSPNNRKGTHEPEVCLKGSQEEIVSSVVRTVTVAGLGPVRMRELISQHGGRRTLHLYVYKAGRSYTPAFFWQQLGIFFNGMLRRNSAGALIRLSLVIEGEQEEAARRTLTEAAQALLPAIDRGLP